MFDFPLKLLPANSGFCGLPFFLLSFSGIPYREIPSDSDTSDIKTYEKEF